MLHTIAWGMPMGAEWLVIAALGLLIFGKRLPEVGRNIGKGIVEFKRGLKEAETEIVSDDTPSLPDNRPQQKAAPEDKFDPYTGKPVEENKTA